MNARAIPILVGLLLMTGCGGSDAPVNAPTTRPAPTRPAVTRPAPSTTSERLGHWRQVVKPMGCKELAVLERRRLAVAFNDQTESLIAIHDRQRQLNCPG